MIKIGSILKKSAIYFFVAFLGIYNVFAYEFVDEDNAYYVKSDRRAIYDLVNLYYSIVGKENTEISQLNYSGICSMVTVEGKGTYPLDEYVAGVIKAEVGVYSAYPEYLKAQAIAVRSFLLATKSNGSTCTVKSSESYQVFREINPNSSYDQKFLSAAQETSGMVVMRDGKVALTQYMSYPSPTYSYDVDGKWTVTLQKYNNDPNTTWTWVGTKSKNEIQSALGYHAGGVRAGHPHHWGMSQTIGAWLGHEGYSYEEIIDIFYGTENSELAMLSDGNYIANVEFVDSDFGTIWYYNQGDYSDYYYSSDVTKAEYKGSAGSWATIASHGCGPTSLAIVLSSFANTEINPMTVTQQTCQMMGCTKSGSSFGVMQDLAEVYGYKTEFVKKSGQVSKVTQALAKGDSLVIALMGPGTFTRGGHYIVLTGTRSDGKVSVADPASRNKTETKWFSFNLVVEEAKPSGFLIITK